MKKGSKLINGEIVKAKVPTLNDRVSSVIALIDEAYTENEETEGYIPISRCLLQAKILLNELNQLI